MKKLLFTLAGIFAGIVVLLIVAIVAGPSVIDLRPYIAKAAREATGRDLRIDGELHLALLPKLWISASDIHFSNAPGAAAPEMLSVGSVALDAELWPLLGKRLVVNSMVVDRPTVNLEMDQAGRPNWEFAGQKKAEPAPAERKHEAADNWLAGLRVDEFRVQNGQLSYRNAVTGQAIDAKDATLTASIPELDRPLTMNSRMVLNDEPVAAEISVDALGKLQRAEAARVKMALDATHATAKFDGAARQRPVPGLDGTFDLDIPSVAKLASWLKSPLDPAQPDPGPLNVHAVFASEGTKSVLKEATVAGAALDVKASGSVEMIGDGTRIAAVVETGVLDIDRYLPPQREKAAPSPPAKAPAERQAPGGDPLAGLSDKPFDLSGFRRLDADVKVSIAGIKALGYEVGKVAFTATAKNGVLAADLSEIALYGGTVTGMAKIDGAGDALALDTNFKIDRVTVDKLAQQPGSTAPPPVSGIVSATLDAKARGASPRALAEDMRAHLAADLGGVAVKDAAARAISQLKLVLDVPGADTAPRLEMNVVYNGEPIAASASVAPLRQLTSGERFPAKLAVDSKVLTLRYDGAVQQKPVPGLDGTFDVDVPSVGKLAAWAGRPLDSRQPDPGPLKVHAVLASDGAKLAIKDAAISGKAITATALATFDGGMAPASFDAKVDIQQANLDAYLPPPSTQPAAKPTSPPPSAAAASPSGWSAEPFDLAALGQANGKAELTLAAVRYRDLDITKGAVTLTLSERVLKVTLDKLAIAQGTIDGAVILDGSGDVPRLEQRIAVSGIQIRPLLKAFAGTDRLGGTMGVEHAVKGSGRTEMELISSLDGSGRFKITDGAIYGINLADTLRKAGSLGLAGGHNEKTDFAELSGSYTIKSGVLENRDLKMLAAALQLSGKGTVPMPQQTIDYHAEAKLTPSVTAQGSKDALVGVPIPIRITGPWSHLSYEPDWSSVVKGLAASPEQLTNLPGNLGKAAKDLGSLPNLGGAGASIPSDVKDAVPGLPSGSSSAPPDAKKKPGLPVELPKSLFGK